MEQDDDLLEQLAEEFLERSRNGERPSIEEYVARCPDRSEQIRGTLQTVAAMEEWKSQLRHGADLCSAPPLEMPPRVGEYEILSEIGRGGMGVVYRARQESLGRSVALKVMTKGALDPVSLIRFQREARAAARLHHSNIVPVFQVDQDDGRFYYAMQLIDGCNLDQVVEALRFLRDGPCDDSPGGSSTNCRCASTPKRPPDNSHSLQLARALIEGAFTAELPGDSSSFNDGRSSQRWDAHRSLRGDGNGSPRSKAGKSGHFFKSVAAIGRQAAEALAYAHSRGIIHRDIKPSNLILDQAGVVWVGDFGLAKEDDEGLTQTGDFVGTIRYMSPERFRGECDPRADIYALGLSLYELIALRPAFYSADRIQLVNMVATTSVTRLRALDARTPLDLETIIFKAIDRDPQNRYATAGAMADDLKRFIDGRPIQARPLSLIERTMRWCHRNKPLAASLAAVACLMLLFAVALPIALVREIGLRRKATAAEQLAEERRDLVNRNLYYAEMNLAGQAANTPGGSERIAELTSRWSPQHVTIPYRGWEWFYLRSLCGRELVKIVLGPSPGESRWSHDGTRLAVGSDGATRIFDTHTWRILKRLTRHRGTVLSVAWSRDDRLLATCGTDQVVYVWDVATWSVRYEMSHTEEFSAVAWSPTGPELVATTRDGVVRIWNSETGQESPALDWHVLSKKPVSWHPSGKWFATATAGEIKIVSAQGTEIRTIWQSQYVITSLAWNADGTLLASMSNDGTTVVWDGNTWQPKWSLHVGRLLRHVAWSPDGKQLAIASGDRGVRLLDAGEGYVIRELKGHTDAVNSVEWSPSGDLIATTSNDQTLRVWPAAAQSTSTVVAKFGRFESKHVAYHPDGELIALCGVGPAVRLVNLKNGRVTTLLGHTDTCSSIAWNADGSRLATSSHDNAVIIWDPTTGEPVHRFEGAVSKDANPVLAVITCVAWSADGTSLAYGSRDGSFVVRDAVTGEVVRCFDGHAAAAGSVDWHPVTPLLVTGSTRGRLLMWSPVTGEVLQDIPAHSVRLIDLRWSPNGSRFGTAGADGLAKIWSAHASSGHAQPLCTLKGHFGPVRCLRWHPDGTRIATGSDDGSLRIWDTASGAEVLTIWASAEPVFGIDWSPDGRQLVSASDDGIVRLWDASAAYKDAIRGPRQ